jgi:hypothetical protein
MADASMEDRIQGALFILQARVTALETEARIVREELALLGDRAPLKGGPEPMVRAVEELQRSGRHPVGAAQVSEQERQAEIRHAVIERRREAERRQKLAGEREDPRADEPAA